MQTVGSMPVTLSSKIKLMPSPTDLASVAKRSLLKASLFTYLLSDEKSEVFNLLSFHQFLYWLFFIYLRRILYGGGAQLEGGGTYISEGQSRSNQHIMKSARLLAWLSGKSSLSAETSAGSSIQP